MTRKGGVFMRVHLPKNGGMTMIENTFIDQFMPAASGDFVKIYLYLLRCAQGGLADVTVPQIADALNYTESDVRRAMGYWQKLKMLDMENEDSKAAGHKIREFRPARKADGDEIRRLLFVAENYLNRPLSQAEQRTLLYFVNDLGMDNDLIDYLLDYCISQNHTSFHYIEKVAQSWTERGIRTVEQARREGSSGRKEYYAIFRTLGIQDHAPTQAETEYMDRWIREYALPMDVILLACQRTILQIGKAQFAYTDSILKSWHEDKVSSLEDVEKLDRLHEEAVRRVQKRQAENARPSADGRFVNFEHSGSDWDDLAYQVMQAQEDARRTQES